MTVLVGVISGLLCSALLPLRWSGILRGEPPPPWGYGLEMSLTSVEIAAGTLPVTGGMRIAYTPHEGDPALPELRAGDEISILAEERLPLVYQDPDAFDGREFLARENIHLLATLRSSKLLEKTGAPEPTILLTQRNRRQN